MDNDDSTDTDVQVEPDVLQGGSEATTDAADTDDGELDFSWSENEDQEVSEQSEEATDTDADAAGYVFELGEESQIPSEIHGELGSLAQELGLPGDKAAQFLNKAVEVYNGQVQQAARALGQALKREWGRDFEERLKATKSFAARLGREAGLKAEDMQPLMSPYGVRLLDAMRRMVSEGGGFAGRANSVAALTPQQRLDAFYADGAKLAAVLDPSHPLHESVNAELNALYGID